VRAADTTWGARLLSSAFTAIWLAYPIAIYNVVHTIGKAALGGRPGGTRRFSYHGEVTLSLVWYPLRRPRDSGRPTASTGFLGMSKKIAGNEKGIMVEVEFQRILILQRVLILCYGAK